MLAVDAAVGEDDDVVAVARSPSLACSHSSSSAVSRPAPPSLTGKRIGSVIDLKPRGAGPSSARSLLQLLVGQDRRLAA